MVLLGRQVSSVFAHGQAVFNVLAIDRGVCEAHTILSHHPSSSISDHAPSHYRHSLQAHSMCSHSARPSSTARCFLGCCPVPGSRQTWWIGSQCQQGQQLQEQLRDQ